MESQIPMSLVKALDAETHFLIYARDWATAGDGLWIQGGRRIDAQHSHACIHLLDVILVRLSKTGFPPSVYIKNWVPLPYAS